MTPLSSWWNAEAKRCSDTQQNLLKKWPDSGLNIGMVAVRQFNYGSKEAVSFEARFSGKQCKFNCADNECGACLVRKKRMADALYSP